VFDLAVSSIDCQSQRAATTIRMLPSMPSVSVPTCAVPSVGSLPPSGWLALGLPPPSGRTGELPVPSYRRQSLLLLRTSESSRTRRDDANVSAQPARTSAA
jgi:hypothetical protein